MIGMRLDPSVVHAGHDRRFNVEGLPGVNPCVATANEWRGGVGGDDLVAAPSDPDRDGVEGVTLAVRRRRPRFRLALERRRETKRQMRRLWERCRRLR